MITTLIKHFRVARKAKSMSEMSRKNLQGETLFRGSVWGTPLVPRLTRKVSRLWLHSNNMTNHSLSVCPNFRGVQSLVCEAL